MKAVLKLFYSATLLWVLSGCASFDNLVKLPVENLRTTPAFETADFYSGKTLALTVFSPEGSYDDFQYGDPALISYSNLFAKTMQAKRPQIDLVTQEQVSAKLSNREFVTLTTRIARTAFADPADIAELAKLSSANYITIAKIRGFSSDSEMYFAYANSRMIEYKSARSTFTIYDATDGKSIWRGSFDHTSDDSWGEPSWSYMMERMYDGFVLRLPTPPK